MRPKCSKALGHGASPTASSSRTSATNGQALAAERLDLVAQRVQLVADEPIRYAGYSSAFATSSATMS